MTRGSFSSSRWSLIVSGIDGHAGLLQDGRGEPLLLVEQRQQDVFDVDLLVVEPGGEFLRVGERLLGFLGEFVQIHDWFLHPASGWRRAMSFRGLRSANRFLIQPGAGFPPRDYAVLALPSR